VISVSAWMVSLSLLTALPVEATRLDGQKQSGELNGLSATSLQLQSTSGAVEIPIRDLQELKLGSTAPAAPLQLQLVDQSTLGGETLSVAAGILTLESAELGSLKIPTERLRSLLLSPLEAAQGPAWEEMKAKVSQSDLLIVRKGENLDFVGGTIGSIDEQSVAVISRGREVKVPREKVAGVVYATHPIVPGSPTCEVVTARGSRLRAKSVVIQDGRAQLELVGIPAIGIPAESLQSLDFALGRIQPLMKALSRQTLPTGVSESVVAIRSHAYSPNSFEKVPLKLGDKTYNDGLLVHPQTKLEFTLNRQFRKLRAIVGIDENSTERGRFEPVVQVKILGDGQPIWEQTVRWDAAPVSLELEVANVRTLELQTLSEDGKIGPLRHLDLADAKLIK
jgi:hypothetical protein